MMAIIKGTSGGTLGNTVSMRLYTGRFRSKGGVRPGWLEIHKVLSAWNRDLGNPGVKKVRAAVDTLMTAYRTFKRPGVTFEEVRDYLKGLKELEQ